jgi:hypothetical protein
MSSTDPLIEFEREGWEALSASGEAAGRFYAENLASEVLMLLPGGIVLSDREKIIESMGGSPWASFELSDERVLELGPDSAVVAYRATAQRETGTAYTALFNSTYIREDGTWKLALHQQTPI